jgi:hypothetical protein
MSHFRASILESQKDNSRLVIGAVLLALCATLTIMLLHPSLGVRDVDGYAYIIGARSLREGNGYRDFLGQPLNHWPPGYSLLLSLSGNTFFIATVVNYFSFGVTVGLLYYLLLKSGWSWQAALGLSTALGSGFLRLQANSAHADILTYALFLTAICALDRAYRLLPSLIWALLIPIKLIAVIFLPAAFTADLFVSRWSLHRLFIKYAPGAILSVLCVAGLLTLNQLTIQQWIPSSHHQSSLGSLLLDAKIFIFSVPREFLFGWYGTVLAPFPRIAFLVCMLLVLTALLSMRPAPERTWYTAYGISALGFSSLLLLVREYTPSVRLVGYGLIVLFFGFRPRPWANPIWLFYGLASLVTAVVNAMTVNSLGSMDPHYAELAAQTGAEYKDAKTIATNSYHILDLHANLPSVPVSDYSEAINYERFLWVTLPNYSQATSTITPIVHPGPEWCEEKRFVGGVLFGRCGSLGQSTK